MKSKNRDGFTGIFYPVFSFLGKRRVLWPLLVTFVALPFLTVAQGSSTNTAAVAAAAQAFEATLSASQITTLQLSYSLTNARAWTNLPVGSRNGLKLGNLSTAQQAAAATLIATALSTQGYTEFEQIRQGDQVIHLTNTGQSWGYDLYYVAFIGTPSTSTPWMLQISGHHLAFNETYNGYYTSATPVFLGTEPPNWRDSSSVAHAPLETQRAAVYNLATALQADSAVSATAKLSGTFTDVVMGATGSGDTNYPQTYPTGTTGRGVSYASLSTSEQALVRSTIEAWVKTQTDDVANELLAVYESDAALAQTYVGYGVGTGGTADFTANPSGLTSQHSYLRVDGPRVWVEFVSQQGVAYPTQVHYHTVWRDKTADYGADFSSNVATAPTITTQPASISETIGGSASLSVVATGTAPLSYQWYKDSVALANGTSSTYTIASVTASSAGSYTVVVTNSAGSATSSAATLTIATASTLADTGFEKGDVGSNSYYAFQYNPTSTAWTFSSYAGITGNNSGFTSGNSAAPEGVQVAFIQASGSMGQEVVLAAGTYAITAQVANRVNWGDQQTVLVYIDAQLVGTFQGGSSYTLATTNAFTVAAGTHSIDFIGITPTDATLFLDQIALVSAATVSNNGFEKPAVGTDDYYAFQYNPVTVADTQNWTFTGNAGVTGNNSGFTSGNATAPDGTQVAFLQTDDSSISQSISFPTSGIYTLSTVTAQRGNWNIGPQRANVYLDDVLVGMASPTSATYEKVSLAISASAGAHVLSFKGVAGNDCTLFIDQVTLVLQQ